MRCGRSQDVMRKTESRETIQFIETFRVNQNIDRENRFLIKLLSNATNYSEIEQSAVELQFYHVQSKYCATSLI